MLFWLCCYCLHYSACTEHIGSSLAELDIGFCGIHFLLYRHVLRQAKWLASFLSPQLGLAESCMVTALSATSCLAVLDQEERFHMVVPKVFH